MLASLLLVMLVLSIIPSRALSISPLVMQVEVLGLTSVLEEEAYDDKVRPEGDDLDGDCDGDAWVALMVDMLDCINIAGVLELRR